MGPVNDKSGLYLNALVIFDKIGVLVS